MKTKIEPLLEYLRVSDWLVISNELDNNNKSMWLI